jgi:toxin ParE1/3/4
MARLTWTDHALDKIENICKYLDKYDLDSSMRLMFSVKKGLDLLKGFPKMGRIVPERNNKNLREIFIEKFRFIYFLNQNNITIITILHFKQNFTLK